MVFAGENDEREAIEVVQLRRLLDVVAKPFPYPKHLDLYREEETVALMSWCFPTVTWLRLRIFSSCRDESILEPIARMSQLQSFEIVGYGDKRDHSSDLPARAFIPLGSLTRLKSLNIGTSFFPCCMDEDDDPRDFEYFTPSDKFTRADTSDMFSRLTALEYLSIFIDDYCCPGHLYDSISEYCPRLGSFELIGKLDPQDWIRVHAPVLKNVRQITPGDIKPGMAGLQVARILDNFVPRLRKLIFKGERSRSKVIYDAWVELKGMKGLFKNIHDSQIEEFVTLAN